MSYNSNNDEREFSNFYFNAGALDLRDSLYDLTKYYGELAPDLIAYGELTTRPILQSSIVREKDTDIFSLGTLNPGNYRVTVSNHVWDSQNAYLNGFISNFSVLNQFGATVGFTNYSAGTLNFNVSSAATHYVEIVGSTTSDAQYSIRYENVNTPAVWSGASLTPPPPILIGNILTANVSYSDADGILGVVPTVRWYKKSGGLYIDTGQTGTEFLVTPDTYGYEVAYQVSFEDNAGNTETSPYYYHANNYVKLIVGNEAPLILSPTSSTLIAVDEDTPTTAITYQFFDVDGDAVSYSFGTPTKGTITTDETNSTFVYTPTPNVNGDDSFVLTITDGTYVISQAINITIAPVNDDPVLTTLNTIAIDEGTASSPIAFSATDVDGDTLTYTFSTPTKGLITRDDVNDTYVYTPNADSNGSDSFTVSVTDGTVTVTETVNITINAINDDPVLTTSNTITIDEDTPSSAISFAATDVDGDTLTYTFSNPDKGLITRDDANGTYIYTPNTDSVDSDSFTISVSDGAVTVTETVNVTITGVNDDPVLVTPTTLSLVENSASSSISFIATDVDGDTLTYAFSSPTKGTITRDDANATYIYTPNTDANGSDSFIISVTDGTVTITETVNVSIFNLVEGTSSDDTLHGTSRDDNINGLSGHDVITGNLGDDWLSGGLGNDIFHFASSGDGHDTIYAFEHDVDQIKFDGVSYVVGDPDNYAGITETTNGNGDTVIQYGGSNSITLTDAIASSPFELVELSSDRYGDIFTFGLRLKDDPSTTSSDTQIVSEFNDIDIEIGWTSGEFSYWGGYRYGQNDIYDTANSGTGLNLANTTLSSGNPNTTTLDLTYYEAGNLAITENDYLATFMLERSDTSSAQTNSITLKTSQGKVLDTASQQLVSLPTSQTPKSYEFAFSDNDIDVELGTKKAVAAPNPVMFVTNDQISDGLSLRAIEKLGNLVRYEVVLNISDATFKGGEPLSPHHKIKIKNALIFDDSVALKTDIASSEGVEVIPSSFSADFFLDSVDVTTDIKQLSFESNQANPFITDRILEFGGQSVVSSILDSSSVLEVHASNLSLPSSVGAGINYTGSEGSYALFEFVAYGPTITFQIGRAGNMSDVSYGNEISIARQFDDLGKAHSTVNGEVWSEAVANASSISVVGDGYHLDPGFYKDVIGADDALNVLRVISDAVMRTPENQKFGPEYYIAGDFNSDGRLSAADAYDIMQYAVSGIKDGVVFPKWAYVSDLSSNTSTFNNIAYHEPLGLDLNQSHNLDITAILKGDLSSSYDAVNFSASPITDLLNDLDTALIA